MTSHQIRREFVQFFVEKHGHRFVPSSPVVPHDDPSLLFTNAGMNQFKPIFLGQEKRDYTRAVNTQKCIRAGGKHNDLDDVGRSRRHHTFFEMLGNWSFGDYFKAGAIEMAWELLTKVWKLDPERLHVTCYEGNEAAGIPRDTEAADLWKKIAGLSDDHIHYFGKDNFWEMGDTGPCGPCTEIYYDRTPDKTGGPEVNGTDPRVMEIWNLVFIQYNRDASGKLTTLPAQHVDTGMGLERICQVIQGKSDNFATDLWTPLFEKLESLSGKKYGGTFPPTNSVDPAAEAADEQLRHDIAFRVVADHVRCLTFALTDGAVPSNEGRGYVLRRILRRAVRFGRQQLGLTKPFMHELVPVIADTMGEAFPELRKNPGDVAELIKDEEVGFAKTLDRGIELFDLAAIEAIRRAIPRGDYLFKGTQTGFVGGPMAPIDTPGQRTIVARSSKDGSEVRLPPDATTTERESFIVEHCIAPRVISGEDAFKLHDTYGFPIDLTRIMAEERNMSVDIASYEMLMEKAKELARSGGKDLGAAKLADLPPAVLAALAAANVPPTDSSAKFGPFKPNLRKDGSLVSEDLVWIYGKVMAIWNGTDLGLSPATASEDEELAVIADKTCFYAEMGGQVGDRGLLSLAPSGALFEVETTRSAGGYTLHIGRITKGTLRVGDSFTAYVDPARRQTEKNHTTTHLANWALREVLGEGVQQKGSLVDADKLRFDFSHGKSLADDELEKVETLVNMRIGESLPVYAEEAPQELALKINGLRAVFGEKYPPMVRVVSIGAPVRDLLADPGNTKWRQYSIEFCGGTHLSNSGDAKSFAITAEESVSKGIRRLVAVTGVAASAATGAARNIDELIAKAKTGPDDQLAPAIASLNQSIAAGNLPLRAKRRAQLAVTGFQARIKAFEKSAKAKGTGVDAVGMGAALLDAAPPLGPGRLVVGEIAGASDDELRSAMDSIRAKAPSCGVMLAAAGDGKVTFVAAVSDDLIALGLKAGDWIRETAKVAGGGGGGRPQMAQAGGKDPSKIGEALATATAFAKSKIG
jgi:alanyl-tRNA synthetase